MDLEHSERDCCGLWKQPLISGRLYGCCHDCHAVTYHSADVAESAIRQNLLGRTLRHLSNAGDYLNLSGTRRAAVRVHDARRIVALAVLLAWVL